MLQNWEESSECFKEAMHIYGKDLNRMKLRLKQSALRTKRIWDHVFSGTQIAPPAPNTETWELSSQFTEYQNSINGITQRMEQLEKVTLKTFEQKFSQYQTLKRRHVYMLEKEIELLKETWQEKSKQQVQVQGESTSVRIFKAVLLTILTMIIFHYISS